MSGLRTGLIAAILAATPMAAVADAQFRGGPEHTGDFGARGPASLDAVIWRFQTGHKVVASPTVDAGVVYVGSRDGFLYALDAATGAKRWAYRADAGVTSSAAVAGGLVFFQSDRNTVYAVKVANGRLAWKQVTGADMPFDSLLPASGQYDYWTSSPLVLGASVYIGGGDGGVYAFEAASGRRRWRFQTGGRVRATPASDGTRIFVGSYDGIFYALDPASGRSVWRFQTEGNTYFPVGHIQSSAAVADGKVIFGSRDFHVYALEAVTGRPAWKTLHEDSWVISSPAVAGGRVYIGSSDGHFIQALDLATGTEIWRQKSSSNIFASPSIAGANLYIGGFSGRAAMAATADGKVSSVNEVDDRIVSSFWLSGGVGFVGSNNGSVYAFGAPAPAP